MNRIHPTAIVGPGVVLGTGNIIGPYAVVLGPCRVGDDNWIGPHVSIGGPPEIIGAPHPAAWDDPAEPAAPAQTGGVVIGSGNTFREYTCVHQPSTHQTVVGDRCYVMNQVYIPHDAWLGDHVTIASSVAMGGHVRVGDGANLGLGATIHQYRVVGPGAMVGMGTVVTRDVPPYAMCYGNPGRVQGVNQVGMRRAGLEPDAVASLAARYAAGGGPPTPADAPPGTADAFKWWAEADRL